MPARESNGTNSTSRGFVAWPGPAISDGFFAPTYPRGPVYDLGQAGVILSARALSNIEASSWSHILALLLFRIYFHNFYCSIKCPRRAEAMREKWSENNNGHHRSRKDDDVRIIGTSVSFARARAQDGQEDLRNRGQMAKFEFFETFRRRRRTLAIFVRSWNYRPAKGNNGSFWRLNYFDDRRA